MSERHNKHNGRDLDGARKVRAEDVEELVTDPDGAAHLRDDVRLGGAVADIGLAGAQRGKEIERLVSDNREDVERVTKAH